jgi:hypothetical protein
MGLSEEGSMGFFPVFRMDIARARLHVDGKYCLRRTALSSFVRDVITRLRGYLRTLYGIPFGPAALPTLGLVILRGHTGMRASPH